MYGNECKLDLFGDHFAVYTDNELIVHLKLIYMSIISQFFFFKKSIFFVLQD